MSRKGKVDINESQVFNPNQIDILESEDRKTWQNPEEIIKHLELNPSTILVDLGCGGGYFSIPISSKVKKIYAIDVQKEMLDYLENKIQKQNIKNIETLLSKDNNIPIQSESIDVLLSVNTFHEFQNRDSMINEICRVLKHKGKAVLVDFKKESTEFGPPLHIRISKEQAIDAFKKKGMIVIKTRDLLHQYVIVFQKEIR